MIQSPSILFIFILLTYCCKADSSISTSSECVTCLNGGGSACSTSVPYGSSSYNGHRYEADYCCTTGGCKTGKSKCVSGTDLEDYAICPTSTMCGSKENMEVSSSSDGVIKNVGGSNLSTGEVCVFNILFEAYFNKYDDE